MQAYVYRVGPKNFMPNSWPWFCEILIDFRNSFTVDWQTGIRTVSLIAVLRAFPGVMTVDLCCSSMCSGGGCCYWFCWSCCLSDNHLLRTSLSSQVGYGVLISSKITLHWLWLPRVVTPVYTRLMALFPGLPRWAGTRKVKPIWILLKQETVSGSGISWAYASLHLAPDR